ncbi:hypothetical protein G6N82_09025 [Altererythrobacter sp. BO-6]|uniref:hypothetical protein n=1 Tax=Altererythrobacter sp. BO-6 TaxID=2604537 RepID=UPI0013E1234F|nr:hypothetical protein [Altererythrobacter sp. BO-6]QIG54268.1 hypothetical protein G6N82_09025 [Altererythrobacter sp. BO-6]
MELTSELTKHKRLTYDAAYDPHDRSNSYSRLITEVHGNNIAASQDSEQMPECAQRRQDFSVTAPNGIDYNTVA